MKRILTMMLCCVGFCSFAESEYTGVTDVYRLKLCVNVPRIYNNTESQGYRKYQCQTIYGYMNITYPNTEAGESGQPEITITGLTNNTHKIGNRKITYKVTVGNNEYVATRVNLIGDNKKNVFKTPSVVFYMDAEPDYNVGEDDEDNSLLCTLSGTGSTKKVAIYENQCVCVNGRQKCKKVKVGEYQLISSLYGFLAGTLGCGCSAYGHVSPTRVNGDTGPTDVVDDVAAIYGKWTATYLRTDRCK